MNGKQVNGPWKGYPADLRAMMMDVYRGDGAYSADQVIGLSDGEISRPA